LAVSSQHRWSYHALAVADVANILGGAVTLLGATRGRRSGQASGGASPWLLVFVTHHPELLLLDCSKFLILFVSVILFKDVTGARFGLAEHTPSSSVAVPSASGTGVVWASASSVHCGHLAGSWALSQATLAVEGTVRLLDRLKGHISLRRCDHIHFYNVKALVGDTLLEP
jgi:hypothetical protein